MRPSKMCTQTLLSSSLTNSTSFSYHILNGQIQWVNTTTATGTGAEQNNLNFRLTGSTVQLVNIKNATSQVIDNQKSIFNPSSFQQNESQLLSSANSAISSSNVKYDNWGNVIFREDPLGREIYYSYSNTNTSNSFSGSSGFTNSF